MEQLHALVGPDDRAVNFVVADAATAVVPEGHTLVAVPAGMSYGFGWLWNGMAFIDPTPVPSLDQLKQTRLTELASLRWARETGGTLFNGVPVATDAVSQTKYIGAVVGAQINPDATLRWKMVDGSFVALDAEQITALAMTVRAHVQACFDHEADLRDQILGCESPSALDEIDITQGWPA